MKFDISSPWSLLGVLLVGIGILNVVAFADDHNITEHGHIVEDEFLEKEYKSLGLRQLEIDVTLQKGIKIKVLNENSLELYHNEDVYTILVDCVYSGTEEKAKLTKIDFFQWVVEGKIIEGSKALVTRNPVKNFGNPAIREMMKNDNARLQNWDFSPRTCTVKAISNIGILFPDALEDVRG